ncbi:MAG: hypothetical protein ACREQJ_13265 [Candidatus Binatia bacterium]
MMRIEKAAANSLRPFVLVERARLARARGDGAAAERELRAARKLFLEAGAPIRAAAIAADGRS